MTISSDIDLHRAVREASTRAVGAAGLGAIALIHFLDLPAEIVRTGASRAWAAGAALAAGALVGYTLTRTTGLPQAHGDVGNWTEPLGLASLFVEGALIALAAGVLALRRTAAGAARPLRAAIAGR